MTLNVNEAMSLAKLQFMRDCMSLVRPPTTQFCLNFYNLSTTKMSFLHFAKYGSYNTMQGLVSVVTMYLQVYYFSSP